MPTEQSSLPEPQLRWYQYSLRTLFIIMFLVAVFSSWLVSYSGCFKRKIPQTIARASIQVALIATPLEGYYMDNGNYPSTDQGIEALWTQPKDLPPSAKWDGPYLPKPLPYDPWGRPYHYILPGKHNPDKYDFWSSGPDGKSGTADDIGNWSE